MIKMPSSLHCNNTSKRYITNRNKLSLPVSPFTGSSGVANGVVQRRRQRRHLVSVTLHSYDVMQQWSARGRRCACLCQVHLLSSGLKSLINCDSFNFRNVESSFFILYSGKILKFGCFVPVHLAICLLTGKGALSGWRICWLCRIVLFRRFPVSPI